jgi:hypothetical protein
MPCSDGGYGEYLRTEGIREKYKARIDELEKDADESKALLKFELSVLKSTNEALQERKDELAQMLCSIMSLLTKHNAFLKETLERDVDGLSDWWQHHMEFDSQRWFEYYSSLYPSLSKEGVTKMVQVGLLDKV